jgi:hypothetical protein
MSDMANEDQTRRQKRMAWVDALPPDMRRCVHEHGLTIVRACWDLGVRKAAHVNHLVETIRRESYQSPRDMAPLNREAARDAKEGGE